MDMKELSSPGGDIDLPSVANLSSFMLDKLAQYGDKIALIDPSQNKTLSFKEVAEGIRSTAKGLKYGGIEKGDVMCMFTSNCVEYYFLFYAVAMVKGIITTANPNLTTRELVHHLTHSAPKWLIVTPNTAAVGLQAKKEAGLHELEIYVISDEPIGNLHHSVGTGPMANLQSFNNILECGKGKEYIVDDSTLEDVFHIPFSSGTAGPSKGVQCRQRGYVATIVAYCHPLFKHLAEDDIIVTFLPMCHKYAQLMILSHALWMGVTNVIMAKFELATFLGLIMQYKATVSYIVPPVAIQLAKNPIIENYDLSTLRMLTSAAAKLPEEIEQQVKDRLQFPQMWQCFGMTEIGCLFSTTNERMKAGSTGMILPGNKVKVVSLETGEALSANQEGEIVMKGPAVMKAYLTNNEGFTPDGWFKTGDVGYFDDDQFFYITGRVKDLIKYNGLQIAPAELESVLLSHPSIADAAVIGIPHSTAGEVPKAYVVLKEGQNISPLAISEYVTQQVAYFKTLRGGVEIVSEIPKSATGKILRIILLEKKHSNL